MRSVLRSLAPLLALALTACPGDDDVLRACPAITCPIGYVMNADCQCIATQCQPSVAKSSPYYDRFEATSLRNGCQTDRDCVSGGCSSEMCAAEGGVSTCELLPEQPAGSCGCFEGQCQWIRCGGGV